MRIKLLFRQFQERFGVLVSEIGQMGFVAVAVFALLAAGLELVWPGFVINWISPKSILAVGVLFGLLSFWPSENVPPVGLSRAVALSVGLVSGVLAFLAARSRFQPFLDWGFWASLATGLTVGLIVWLLTDRRPFDSNKDYD